MRCSHYPNDVRWYSIAARVGLYVVDEANLAFRHNIDVYSEEGGLMWGAAVGVGNMARGFAKVKLVG